jgi:hypothetical protein
VQGHRVCIAQHAAKKLHRCLRLMQVVREGCPKQAGIQQLYSRRRRAGALADLYPVPIDSAQCTGREKPG